MKVMKKISIKFTLLKKKYVIFGIISFFSKTFYNKLDAIPLTYYDFHIKIFR